MSWTNHFRALRADALQVLCSMALMGSLAVAVVAGMHWPLVGDASLMHYVVFLQKLGLTPYKDIVDINLPGTYAFEAFAMRCFGDGAIGWRLYDLALMAAIAGAALMLAGKRDRFAGTFSGVLFALIHLQDGLEQGGQRNLAMAALLLWSYVALIHAQRSDTHNGLIALAGLGLGTTLILKPTMLPLAAALILTAAWFDRKRGRASIRTFGFGMLGLVVPAAVCALWLMRGHAMAGFLWMSGTLLPLHVSLGRQHLSYLLAHCMSPIALIVGLWVLLCLVQQPAFTAERMLLLLGVLGSAFAYVVEGKGYPYQRYPLLAVLLVMIGLDVTRALRGRGFIRLLAICLCSVSCFVLAPRYAWLADSFQPSTPFQNALTAQLKSLDSTAGLQGNVQCLDTFGGCINTLYNLRVRQSTGFLYDCYLFSGDTDANERYREVFGRAFELNKPRLVVATNQFCFGDARGFGKLAAWPRFNGVLAQEYVMQTEWKSKVPQHWWSRREMPTEFRIYLRKDSTR